jgi:primosomal protein N'
MLPARLLRADSEMAFLTPSGVSADPTGLGAAGAGILSALVADGGTRVPALLAKVGCRDRRPLDELVRLGLVELRRQRRDRPPPAEVTAVQIADRPLDTLLEECRRAPRQREVLQWLADAGRPALVAELRAAVGCSPATVRALVDRGAIASFTQPAPRPPRWALRSEPEHHTLTDEQQAAVVAITDAVAAGGYAPFLLEGVTGSGKTGRSTCALSRASWNAEGGLVLVPRLASRLRPRAPSSAASAVAPRRSLGQSEGALARGANRRRRDRVVVGPRRRCSHRCRTSS